MYDLYQCDDNDSSRFILGKNGRRRLIVIGLNPSTANKEKSDTTVAKVEKVARNNEYDGFVMANLYPLRSTKPYGLPRQHDQTLIDQNIIMIIELVRSEKEPVFWAAWGNNITLRPYLAESFKSLMSSIDSINGRWVHYGSLTVEGHPRHPSRLAYSQEFSDFDARTYSVRFD